MTTAITRSRPAAALLLALAFILSPFAAFAADDDGSTPPPAAEEQPAIIVPPAPEAVTPDAPAAGEDKGTVETGEPAGSESVEPGDEDGATGAEEDLSSLGARVMSLMDAFTPATVSDDGGVFDTFDEGTIDGQHGWRVSGHFDQEIVANETGPASFGLKAFRFSNAYASGGFDNQVFAAPMSANVGETDATPAGARDSHFEMSFDFISAVPNLEQPGLTVNLSPDRGDGSRMSYVKLSDSADGVDVSFFDVEGATNPANFVESPVATGLDRSVVHTVKLAFDAIDGPSNDIVRVYVDGELMHTGTSWEDYYRYDAEAHAEQGPRLVNTVLFRANSAQPSVLGKGFLFDHIELSSGTYEAPETVYVDSAFAGTAIGTEHGGHTSGVDGYATIQEGIDAVADGGTVNVAAGTYAESVSITKALTLSGAADHGTVLTGASGQSAVITVTGADGAAIDGVAVMGGTGIENGIDISGSAHVDVRGVLVSSFGKRGIRFAHAEGSLHDSEIIGDNVDGTSRVQNLVNVWGGSEVEIYGNDLHNALTTVGAVPTWSSPAVLVTAYDGAGNADASTASVHDNEIYASDTGVNVGSVYAPGDSSSATVTGNDFHDLATGVTFESEMASATINENSFVNVETALTTEDSVTAHPAVNADRNWWGADADPRTTGQAYPEALIANWYVDAEMTRLNTDPAPSSGGGGGHHSSRRSSSDDSSSSDAGTGTTGSVDSSAGGEVLGASTFNFAADLWFGATGESVNQLQQVLIDAGYLHIALPTGWFGPMTQAAVKLYQAAHGVPATGYVGPLTRGVLNLGVVPAPVVETTSTTTTTGI